MTLSNFISNFETLTDNLIDDDKYYNYLGLLSFDKGNKMNKFSKFGRFGILPLAQEHTEGYSGIFGLQIIPNKGWMEWPLVNLLAGNDTCYTLAPNYKLLPSHCLAKYAVKKKTFDYIRNGISSLKDVLGPVFQLFDSLEKYEILDDYFSNISFRPTEGRSHDTTITQYIDLLIKLNPNDTHAKYREEVEKMRKEDTYIPISIEKEELGVWYTSLTNKLGARALVLEEKVNDLYWNSLLTIHGMDGCLEYADISHYTDTIAPSRSSLGSIARNVEITDEVVENPLHIIINPLVANASQYTGAEHLIAAAVLDEEHKDPLAAFNALVSGAYWAGHNMKKALPKIHNQMLNLCKREGWADAEFALSMMI